MQTYNYNPQQVQKTLKAGQKALANVLASSISKSAYHGIRLRKLLCNPTPVESFTTLR